jgi:hypothetical protein
VHTASLLAKTNGNSVNLKNKRKLQKHLPQQTIILEFKSTKYAQKEKKVLEKKNHKAFPQYLII